MPSERQVRRHQSAKRAESVKERFGNQRVARHNARSLAVVHGLDRRGILGGVEFSLGLDGVLNASVIFHSHSLNPGHFSSQSVRGILGGVEFSLGLDGVLNASVIFHSHSLNPGHFSSQSDQNSSQLAELAAQTSRRKEKAIPQGRKARWMLTFM